MLLALALPLPPRRNKRNFNHKLPRQPLSAALGAAMQRV